MSQQTAPSHTAPSGLDELIRIAEAQPLSPACDHFYFRLRCWCCKKLSERFIPIDKWNETMLAG